MIMSSQSDHAMECYLGSLVSLLLSIRVMAVLDPLKVTITNFPHNEVSLVWLGGMN